MARAADSAQFDGKAADWIGRASVCPSTRSTHGNVRRDLLGEIEDRAGDAVELGRRLRLQRRLAGREQDLRLQDEAIADDADVLAALPRIWRRRPKKSER